jgi:hypothetical protein
MNSPDLISDRDRTGLLNISEPGAGPDFREEPLPRPTRFSKPNPQRDSVKPGRVANDQV